MTLQDVPLWREGSSRFVGDGYLSGLHSQEACQRRQESEDIWRKKREYELGRQVAVTKLLSIKTIRKFRVCGGNLKFQAPRLNTRNYNYSWGSHGRT